MADKNPEFKSATTGFRAARSCAAVLSPQDGGMNYTGTRYTTTYKDGIPHLTGAAEFVNNRISDQNKTAAFGNSGAFCTSKYVVGTATYANNADTVYNGRYAEFWVFGHVNGISVAGTNTLANLERAQLVAKTDAATVSRINGLRVNGAAVVPKLLL